MTKSGAMDGGRFVSLTKLRERRGRSARAYALGQRDIELNNLMLLIFCRPSKRLPCLAIGHAASFVAERVTHHGGGRGRIACCGRARRCRGHDIEPGIRQRPNAMTAGSPAPAARRRLTIPDDAESIGDSRNAVNRNQRRFDIRGLMRGARVPAELRTTPARPGWDK